jgi:ankyrin repeat protein
MDMKTIIIAFLASCAVSLAQTNTNNPDTSSDKNDGWTPLDFAVRAGNVENIELLLDNGADINATNSDGLTALNLAVMEGQTNAAEILLDKGADIGNDDLKWAAWNGSVEIIKRLLAKGADVNTVFYGTETALINAALAGKFEAVKFLLENGADVNAKEVTGETALIFAAGSGQTNVVEILLDNGADINAQSMTDGTALMEAAFDGNIDVVKLLLARGADVNAVVTSAVFGKTALEVAKKKGNAAIMELLQPVNLAVASGTNTDSSGYVTNAALLMPFTLTNSDGDVLTNAVLVKLMPNKFIYKTTDDRSEGVLPLASLPEKLRDKFGYNSTTAAAADALDAEKHEQWAETFAEGQRDAANQILFEQTKEKMIKEGQFLSLNFVQLISPDSALCSYSEGTMVLLTGIKTDALADGAIVQGIFYPCGTYTYTTVMNAEKTVRKYTLHLDDAIQYTLDNPN